MSTLHRFVRRLPHVGAVVLLMGSTLSVSEASVSAATWSQRTVAGSNFYAAAMSDDGSRQIAASYGGYLYTSADGGSTWAQKDSVRNWYSVDTSADGMIMYAASERVDNTGAGSQGSIHKSTDGGATWTMTSAPRSAYYQSIATSSDGSVVLASSWALVGVGNNDYLYVSTDGGATWATRDSKRSWRGVAVSADGTKMVAICCGQNGTGRIYRSTDSGATFTAVGPTSDWWFVDFSDDFTKGIAATYNGSVFTTTDGGSTWVLKLTPGNTRDVAISNDGSTWGFVNLSSVYLSTDGTNFTDEAVTGMSGGTWSSLDLSSNGTKAVAASYSSSIKIYGTGNISPSTTSTTTTTSSTTTTTSTTTSSTTSTTVAPSSSTSSSTTSSSTSSTTTIASSSTSTTSSSTSTTVAGSAATTTTPPAGSSGSTTTTTPIVLNGGTATASSSTSSSTTSSTSTTTTTPSITSGSLEPGDAVKMEGEPEDQTPPISEDSLTGQSLVVVDGVVVEARFSREGSSTVMTTADLSIKVSVFRADSTPVEPEADGAYVLEPGMKLTVTSVGLRPSTVANLWMYSDPTIIASVSTASDGTLDETVDSPGALESGRHHFVVNSRTPDGGNVLAVFPMKVNMAPAEGVDIGRIVAIILAVVVAFALVLPPTLRRRRKNS